MCGLDARTEERGSNQITVHYEMNTLYDLPGAESCASVESCCAAPVRKREWILTHKAKGTTGRHKVRVERETRVEDGKQMDEILGALGFAPTFRYEKYRAEWSDGKGHVVVDRTPIGNFGEIEGAVGWIDRTAKTLGIAREDYITQTYAPMFFEWKRRTGSAAKEMTFRAVRGKGI
jgi:adenylate cyclase class 2